MQLSVPSTSMSPVIRYGASGRHFDIDCERVGRSRTQPEVQLPTVARTTAEAGDHEDVADPRPRGESDRRVQEQTVIVTRHHPEILSGPRSTVRTVS